MRAIVSVHAPFTFIGGCASVNPAVVRPCFAVAKSGNRSYSWQALTTALSSPESAAGNKTAFA
jgi:hypothetical protein